MTRSNVVSRIAHETCLDAPPETFAGDWWDRLPEDFAFRGDDFDLTQRDRVFVGATSAMDVGIRTFAASAVGALAVPFGINPIELGHFDADLAFYDEQIRRREPDDFFAPPTRRVSVRCRPARVPLFKPTDGVVEDLEFESPFQPSLPRLRTAWAKQRRNRRAVARLWRHDGPVRPTIVAIHGFGAEQSWINEWMLALPRLYQLGCDILLMTLPFHGPRKGLFSPFSGHGFFSGGISWINESFAQAVCDFRVIAEHLRMDRGVPRIGVTGISLGGCTTALVAAADPDIAFAIPNVPVTSLADLLLEWKPLSGAITAMLHSRGLGIRDLRHALAPSSPLTWRPQVPFERRMIIGGVGDRVTPPKHSRLLWEHWDRCRLHWFPGGHVMHLDKGEYLIEMGRFLRDADFLPERRQTRRASRS